MVKHKGTALISALFMMAIIAMAATAMSKRLQTDIYSTNLLIQHNKLNYASQLGTFWGIAILSKKNITFTNNSHAGLKTNYPGYSYHIAPNITIHARLIDLQAKFNINNLRDKHFNPLFQSLLSQILPSLSVQKRKIIMNAIHERLSYKPAPENKEAIAYNRSGYKIQNRHTFDYIQDISELLFIDGITNEIYNALKPYLVALPDITPININHADAIILKSLVGRVKKEHIDIILQKRKTIDFRQNREFIVMMRQFNISLKEVTIDSQYFLCTTEATIDDITIKRYTLLKRSYHPQTKQYKVEIINDHIV